MDRVSQMFFLGRWRAPALALCMLAGAPLLAGCRHDAPGDVAGPGSATARADTNSTEGMPPMDEDPNEIIKRFVSICENPELGRQCVERFTFFGTESGLVFGSYANYNIANWIYPNFVSEDIENWMYDRWFEIKGGIKPEYNNKRIVAECFGSFELSSDIGPGITFLVTSCRIWPE